MGGTLIYNAKVENRTAEDEREFGRPKIMSPRLVSAIKSRFRSLVDQHNGYKADADGYVIERSGDTHECGIGVTLEACLISEESDPTIFYLTRRKKNFGLQKLPQKKIGLFTFRALLERETIALTTSSLQDLGDRRHVACLLYTSPSPRDRG